MNLTGKCKDEFEKWYVKNQHNDGGYHDYLLRSFYSKGLSMQYGVYVDFFDSVGFMIQVSLHDIDSNNWQYCIEMKIDDILDEWETHCVSRQEAREQAIQKANEIFNNR